MVTDPLADFYHVLGWVRSSYTFADLADPFQLEVQENDFRTTLIALATGSCLLRMPDASSMEMKSGDMVLLSRGGKVSLAAKKRLQQTTAEPTRTKNAKKNFLLIRNNGDGDRTIIISCAVRLDHPAGQRLVQILDPFVPITALSCIYADCVSRTLALISTMVRDFKSGDDKLLMNLSDALIMEALRTAVSRSAKAHTDRLSLPQDRQIGVAVSLIQDAPQRDWSLASLSTAAGMSRSIFAERFCDVVGEPPMRYLMRVRMHLAVTLLTRGEERISLIAHRVGYTSEASFSRAFRRFMGVSPSSLRRLPAELPG